MNAEKICAEKSKKPVSMLPKIPIPTAAIRKGGPAFTQKQSILAPVFRSIFPSRTESLIHFAAEGYPPMVAESKIPPQLSGILKSFVTGRKSFEKNSAALLLQIKTESAIKGKSAGIT